MLRPNSLPHLIQLYRIHCINRSIAMAGGKSLEVKLTSYLAWSDFVGSCILARAIISWERVFRIASPDPVAHTYQTRTAT
jgi:hypothetical protein